MQKFSLIILLLLCLIIPFQSYATIYGDLYAMPCEHAAADYNNNTLYFWCRLYATTPTATFPTTRKFTVTQTSTIISAAWAIETATQFSSNELATASISVVPQAGGGTIYNLGNIQYNASNQYVFNNLSIPVNVSDRVEFRVQTPTWATTTKQVTEEGTIYLTTNQGPGTIMSTTTDAIIGNVFNQIYLLGWFFFFFVIVWIVFKITKR